MINDGPLRRRCPLKRTFAILAEITQVLFMSLRCYSVPILTIVYKNSVFAKTPMFNKEAHLIICIMQPKSPYSYN